MFQSPLLDSGSWRARHLCTMIGRRAVTAARGPCSIGPCGKGADRATDSSSFRWLGLAAVGLDEASPGAEQVLDEGLT